MPEDPLTLDLHTTVHIFAPLLLLSLLTGGVLEFSSWFGFPLAWWLHITGGWAHLRITEAQKVHVKAVEAYIVGVLLLVCTAASVVSPHHFPLTTKAFALAAISLTPSLIALIHRQSSQKVNPTFLLVAASLILITSVAASGFTDTSTEIKDQPSTGHFVITFPTALLTVAAAAAMYRVVFVLREKVSVADLRWLTLLIACCCGIAALGIYLTSFSLSTELLTATAASALLFLFLDFLEHQIGSSGVRIADWTSASTQRSLYHVGHKLAALVAIGLWGGLAAVVVPASYDPASKAEDMAAELRRIDQAQAFDTFYTLAILVAHALHAGMRVKARHQEPLLPDVERIDLGTAVRLTAIVAAVCAMLSIGCYFNFAPRPLSIPQPILLMATASLFLLLAHLLDEIRAFIAPFNHELRNAAVGLCIYLVIYSVYTMHTGPGGQTTNSTGVTAPLDATGDARFARITVASLALCYSLLLVLHFYLAISEDDAKWRRSQLAKAAIAGKKKAPAAKNAQSAPLLGQEDVSDDASRPLI